MFYIEDQGTLNNFAARAKDSKVLAIDTEFLRDKSYYPKLCLLQMATDSEVAIVDPFVAKDLSVLVPLLLDQNIVKLFHAGHQDLEILYRETGVLPNNIFDTQIAAALLGHSHQMGFASAVHAFCGKTIKKMDSFTDWSRRPLAKSQINYAAEDVIFLPQLYNTMRNMLEERGRMAWLEPDFEELADPANYVVDPYERFRHLKRGNQLIGRQLAAARELAAWREIQAQKRNIPRKWILSDEQLVETCKRDPKTIDDLFMVRGVREHTSVRDARAIIDLFRKVYKMPESEWPESEQPVKNFPNVDFALDLMEALVRLRAKENDIAMQTLASRSELAKVARGITSGVNLLKGWRRKLVGDELLDLLNGRISLCLNNNELQVIRND